MMTAVATLSGAILLAILGLMGVGGSMAALVQVGFFSLLVVFVVQMVRLIVHDL